MEFNNDFHAIIVENTEEDLSKLDKLLSLEDEEQYKLIADMIFTSDLNPIYKELH